MRPPFAQTYICAYHHKTVATEGPAGSVPSVGRFESAANYCLQTTSHLRRIGASLKARCEMPSIRQERRHFSACERGFPLAASIAKSNVVVHDCTVDLFLQKSVVNCSRFLYITVRK